jgi:hypothetical protein
MQFWEQEVIDEWCATKQAIQAKLKKMSHDVSIKSRL